MNMSTILNTKFVVDEFINMADKDDCYKLEWCHCKECYAMTTQVDEMCCSKPVGTKCITKNQDFKTFVDGNLIESDFKPDTWAPKSLADLTSKAYKLLKEWKHIPSGYNNDWTTNLPSCVKWYIRKKLFPELYTGYYPDSGLNSRSYSYFQWLCTISKWVIGMNLHL